MNKNFLQGLSVVIALVLTACNGCRVNTDGVRKSDVTKSESRAVSGTPEDFASTTQTKVYYNFDSSNVTASGKNSVKSQAGWLKTYPDTTATIAGHTDERGTAEYNMALGARRAEATKSALVSEGVDANRLTTISYGKDRPEAVVDASNPRMAEAAHAKNRRTETTIN